ncbi:MAG: hypothetical protein OJF51_000286 [Nitrospira sp.]|jgi:hypothetical protein|nr:MAG: hypothetical protein OJF51_000286 [Nitrospira sp.]
MAIFNIPKLVGYKPFDIGDLFVLTLPDELAGSQVPK